MKTKSTNITICISFLFFAVNIHAQSWLTTGNTGTTPSKNFLGTQDKSSLVFKTSNLERMRIASTGKIGIGTQSPTQKLDVHGNINLTDTLYFPGLYSTGTIYADNYGLNINSLFDGVVNIGSVNQSSTALAATSADNAIAAYSTDITIEARCDYPQNDGDFLASAVLGYTNGGKGVIGMSDSSYGVYASTKNTKSYAGYFDGNIYTTGYFTGSDEKLKQNIQDFSSALDIINQLHPKQYQYKQDGNYKLMSLPQGQHYGLIAQDVEKVLPNLVKETVFNTAGKIPQKPSDDPKHPNQKIFQKSATGAIVNFKALNYTELIPLLIKGMQEQQQSIEALKQINQQQQDQINQLKNLIETKLSNSNILSNQSATLSSAALLQNTPNPYKNSTSIAYNLPIKFSSAQIIITDNLGKILKQVNVSGIGKGSVNIDASSLTPGSYNYSLWIDKKLIETKQMLLQK